MRFRERQWAQQQCVDDAEDGDVGANAEGQDQDSDKGEAAIVAEGAEGETDILANFIPIILQLSTPVHFVSYANANLLNCGQGAELACGLPTGGFGLPALS